LGLEKGRNPCVEFDFLIVTLALMSPEMGFHVVN